MIRKQGSGGEMANPGCQLDTAEKRRPQLENRLHQAGLWTNLGAFLYLAN
ncbi:hypothetical protein LEMLEM_LOCUS4255 [Lemmus lemmus]